MSFLSTPDFRVHYEISGAHDAPVIVFSNSLGTELAMWNSQASAFAEHFRVLRFDGRGQGTSNVPPGPYSIEMLAQDVIDVMDTLSIGRASFCGLSMGGMVGLTLGRKHAPRFHKLVLCNTAPKIGTAESWNSRIEAVRNGGMAAIVPAVLERWFTPAFREGTNPAVEATQQMLLNASPDGYIACCEAVRDMDQRETVSKIHVPTLIVAGASDPVTPPAEGKWLAEHIAGAQYLELPAAHLSNVEAGAQFNTGVLEFLRA
jgi:3-oxoadipate enol-lactonase